jgi:hypothetical protein
LGQRIQVEEALEAAAFTSHEGERRAAHRERVYAAHREPVYAAHREPVYAAHREPVYAAHREPVSAAHREPRVYAAHRERVFAASMPQRRVGGAARSIGAAGARREENTGPAALATRQPWQTLGPAGAPKLPSTPQNHAQNHDSQSDGLQSYLQTPWYITPVL